MTRLLLRQNAQHAVVRCAVCRDAACSTVTAWSWSAVRVELQRRPAHSTGPGEAVCVQGSTHDWSVLAGHDGPQL